MNKTASLAALALAGVVSFPTAASALTYTGRDILLGIRAATSPVNDLQFDLGQASLFTAGVNGGSTAPITFAAVTAADINATFGSFNNVLWSAFGAVSATDPGTAASPIGTLWVTQTAPSDTTPWLVDPTASQKLTAGKINSIGLNSQLLGAPTANSGGKGVTLSDSNPSSYHSILGANSDFGGTFQGNVETAIDGTFTATAGAKSIADLYELKAGAAVGNPGTLLGSFEFSNNGTLTFVPVPEASTYGLFAGAGLLLLSVRQQFRRRTV